MRDDTTREPDLAELEREIDNIAHHLTATRRVVTACATNPITEREKIMSEATTTEPDLAALEREAAEVVYGIKWEDIEFQVYEMGIGGSHHASRMETLARLNGLAASIGENAERRACEAGVSRFREEIAGLIRGKVADQVVAAWLARADDMRCWLAVVRALQSVMLPEQEYAPLAAEGDGWLDAAIEKRRQHALKEIARYDDEIERATTAKRKTIEYLERCR